MLQSHGLILLHAIIVNDHLHGSHLPPSLNFFISFVGLLPDSAFEWHLRLMMHGSILQANLLPVKLAIFQLSVLLNIYYKHHLSESRSWKAVIESGIAGQVILEEGSFGYQPTALMFKSKVIESRLNFIMYMDEFDFAIHSTISSNHLNNQKLHQEIFGPAAELFQSLEFGDGVFLYVTVEYPVNFFHQFSTTYPHSELIPYIGFTLQSTVVAKAEANNWLISFLGLEQIKSGFIACLKGNTISGELMMNGAFKTKFFTYTSKVSFEANFLDSHFLVKYEVELIYGHLDDCLKFQISMTEWWNPNGGSISLFFVTHDKNRPTNEDFLGLKMSIAFDPFHASIDPANFLQAKFDFDAKLMIPSHDGPSFKQAHIFIDLADQEKSFCLFQNLLIKELTGFFVLDQKPWTIAKNVAALSLSNFKMLRKVCKFRVSKYPYFAQSIADNFFGFAGTIDMYMRHELFTLVLGPDLHFGSSSSSIAADSSEQNRFAFHINYKGVTFITWSHFEVINPELILENRRYHFSGTSTIFDHEIELAGSFAPEGSKLGTFSATIKGETFSENLISLFSALQTETASVNSQRKNAADFIAHINVQVNGDLGSNSFNWKILYNNGDETVVIENLTPNLRSLDEFFNFVKSSLKDPFLVFCSKKRSLKEENYKPQKKFRL